MVKDSLRGGMMLYKVIIYMKVTGDLKEWKGLTTTKVLQLITHYYFFRWLKIA